MLTTNIQLKNLATNGEIKPRRSANKGKLNTTNISKK